MTKDSYILVRRENESMRMVRTLSGALKRKITGIIQNMFNNYITSFEQLNEIKSPSCIVSDQEDPS